MCAPEEFARLRDRLYDLSKETAAQAEQIKTLFSVTKEQGEYQKTIVNRLLCAVVLVFILAVLALVYGALGPHGFNSITHSLPTLTTNN